MENFKERFPILNQVTYLNTPASGLISNGLHDHQQSIMNQLHVDPVTMLDNNENHLNDIRRVVAGFFDSTFKYTGLVPNFSFAFNAVLDLLPISYTVLLLKDDYPSINYPLESRGYTVIYADVDLNLEENILHQIEQHKPDCLCLSIIQYLSGIRVDLEFLKKLKQTFPDLLIIADGTQFLGVEEFCFRKSGIDILIASCYKWMNAGTGCAVITLQNNTAEELISTSDGLTRYDNFSNQRGSLMGHFEPGHLNILPFLSLKYAIKEIQQIGFKVIAERITHLCKLATTDFQRLGLIDEQIMNRKKHSSIFNLKITDKDFQYLYNRNIICARRGEGTRIGLHYFNDENDLDQLLTAINLIK